MKRYLGWLALFITAFSLTGCLYQTSRSPTADLTCENWQRQVATDPRPWAAGASNWFKIGDVNCAGEGVYKDAPVADAMTTMSVKVPESITRVRVNGRFKVEIFGTQDANSVNVYGANDAARHVKFNVSQDTLYISEVEEDAPRNMNTVIVRIGIRQLRQLEQLGCGQIEARYIQSNFLHVTSKGAGNIYLGGIFNLARVECCGRGNISLFGAMTPRVDIVTSGSGSVNISGKVGIHNITHHGIGNISIIGANSRDAIIHADGRGKISINGILGVREIDARDKTAVFIYYVSSDILNVHTTDRAHVGVAGCVRAMNVDAMRASRFDGRYLYAAEVYIRASDMAHVNVMGTDKVFAKATGNSSVYLFSSPTMLSRFASGRSVILPIPSGDRVPCGFCPYFKMSKSRVYKD